MVHKIDLLTGFGDDFHIEARGVGRLLVACGIRKAQREIRDLLEVRNQGVGVRFLGIEYDDNLPGRSIEFGVLNSRKLLDGGRSRATSSDWSCSSRDLEGDRVFGGRERLPFTRREDSEDDSSND
ncbi:MAG: hypothetical protein KDN22_10410 [Verrucomicrobiae bacterium]|nr:hypothetical protein [Verrucomicrobiae bacterium]